MATAQLEIRIAALEAEMAQVREHLTNSANPKEDWLDAIYGAFADDPHFEEAMRLGREYRESLRPKARKKAARKTVGRDSKKSVKGRRR